MKKKIIGIVVGAFLLTIAYSGLVGSYEIEKNKAIPLPQKNPITLQEQPLQIALEPGLLSRGIKIQITNTGNETLSDIHWCFSTKPVITAILGKGDVCHQTIDELQAGAEITIVLRPFLSDMPSPRGFGRVYMRAQAQAATTEMVRDQKQAFLLFCFLLNIKDTYIDVPPDEAYALYVNDTFDLIIDVVGLDIYNLGHLPGAVNYVWADGTLNSMIPTLDKNGTYLVYCHTDPPSTDSAQALVDAGISNTYRLEGNYRAWVEAGYPTET
jgi:rhodanese-related sulfurtransferase